MKAVPRRLLMLAAGRPALRWRRRCGGWAAKWC